MPARLLECRKRGNAGAGVCRGEALRHALIRKEVAAVRHYDVRAVAAGAPSAEGSRIEAEQFLALPAHCAFPAADPRVGNHLVTDLDARGLRSERHNLACDFVSHRERQVHAARFKRDGSLPAQIEVPVPNVDVAMADPGRLDAQQHFLSLRFGIWILSRFQWLSPFDDLHRTHDRILRFPSLAPQHIRGGTGWKPITSIALAASTASYCDRARTHDPGRKRS